jgi:hypothetical protein
MTAPAHGTRSRRETLVLTLVGVACAGASSLAFFLHVLGFVRMPFFINFAGLPVIILFLIIGIYSWNKRLPFWNRFRAGLLAGLIGLIAYDVLRFAIMESNVLDYDPFHAIPILGSLITGMPPEAGASVAAGWAYHIWNGFSFAIIYALIAGPATWMWGVLFAMILEIGMLFAYPTFLAIQAQWKFVTVSVIGHAAYGVAIGRTVQRQLRGMRAP